MRHKDRRIGPEKATVKAKEEAATSSYKDVPIQKAAHSDERTDKNTSLSASLQRIPSDPVKSKNRKSAVYNYPEDFRDEIPTSDFSSTQHLEDEIPNVAENIMRNIELSLRPKRTRGKQQQYKMDKSAMVTK